MYAIGIISQIFRDDNPSITVMVIYQYFEMNNHLSAATAYVA